MTKQYSIKLQAGDNQGFTLIEMMIAICIMGVGFLAITTMFMSTNKGHENAMRLTEASFFMSSEIDRIMSLNFTDTDLVDGSGTDSGSGTTYDLAPEGRYQCSYTVSDITGTGGTYKLIDLTISWQMGNQLNPKTVTSSIIRLNNTI